MATLTLPLRFSLLLHAAAYELQRGGTLLVRLHPIIAGSPNGQASPRLLRQCPQI